MNISHTHTHTGTSSRFWTSVSSNAAPCRMCVLPLITRLSTAKSPSRCPPTTLAVTTVRSGGGDVGSDDEVVLTEVARASGDGKSPARSLRMPSVTTADGVSCITTGGFQIWRWFDSSSQQALRHNLFTCMLLHRTLTRLELQGSGIESMTTYSPTRYQEVQRWQHQ